jgi:hypothetical protein
MHELLNATYRCAYCGEENETLVDPTGGPEQAYTEDCEVCCRPNALRIHISPEGRVDLSVEFEG